ncbi:MAG: hypothetical protein AVDCRST_MAG28-3260 [uncultured Rubrobacteraceae bacterium]|uniref:Phosphatase n=1 Tax=uncultured Rubrobacteraceae bacterium TaxID=349277 RepID=A0A6J4R482_9ACTN|nr:MAG: hypothetical protein AVDCRST_MAG28-3260 [uncultured Rubrobacteraceae bacterium]
MEIFYEGTDANNMESPDTILVTPFGDLWFAEDGGGENRVMGITPEGRVYQVANIRVPFSRGEPGDFSEFAGPIFSPDGKTFFVNIQNPGITYAIWGLFKKLSSGRQQELTYAAPLAKLAPLVSVNSPMPPRSMR